MKTKHLVIGAGPAGLAAIDTVRESGDSSDITLVCDEPPYSRMVLPYLMDGTISEEQVFTASDEYLETKRVTSVTGKRVDRLDPSGVATLDDGTTIEFSDVLVATGSSATRPPIPGADSEGVYNLWTLDDAKNVIARKGGEVAVIGAGFIAFTCLDAFVHLGAKVKVIEVEDRILPRMVDPLGAKLVQSWLESKGVEFQTGVRVTGIEDSGSRKRLVLGSGRALEADVVIMATGITPNLDLLDGSQIQIEDGIVVDERMLSSAKTVYAAGDVAQGPVVGSTKREVHAIQPTALEHGRVAGANMAGGDVHYWGSLLMNIVDVQKLQIASFGDWSSDADVIAVSNERRTAYRKMVFDGDRMIGAILLGRPSDVAMLNDMGMLKGLIQTQVELKEWRRYLDQNPLDIRRPYVASRAAERLLDMRLLSKPSNPEGYRHPDPEPRYWDYHEIFVGTRSDPSQS